MIVNIYLAVSRNLYKRVSYFLCNTSSIEVICDLAECYIVDDLKWPLKIISAICARNCSRACVSKIQDMSRTKPITMIENNAWLISTMGHKTVVVVVVVVLFLLWYLTRRICVMSCKLLSNEHLVIYRKQSKSSRRSIKQRCCVCFWVIVKVICAISDLSKSHILEKMQHVLIATMHLSTKTKSYVT